MEDKDKELQNSVSGEVEDMTQDYLETIKTLKQNSVDRSKYEELKAENKKLLNSIVNGEEIDVQASESRTNETLRKALFTENSGLSNLEYAQAALELRSNLMSEGKPDPFVPIGSQYQPTNEDFQTAEKVANVLQDCIDYAEGDNLVFTNELQRRMINTKI